MKSGGVVAGAATTFFYQPEDWERDADRLLHQYHEILAEVSKL